MYSVQFKMFTIIPFFLVPMAILEALSVCLLILFISKWCNFCYYFLAEGKSLANKKQTVLDLCFVQGVFVLPQPLFYIVVEFVKLFGEMGATLYYPNPWEIVV